MITDAQVHIWELSRPERPWPQPGVSSIGTASRPDGFSAEQILADMEASGVDRAVIVPPAVVGFGNLTALEAAARYPARFAVMGLFDPYAADAKDRLETWLDQPGMLGIRLTATLLTVSPDDETIDWFWTACERLRIPVAINVFGRPEPLAAVVRWHPDLSLIVDHMAVAANATTVVESFAPLDGLLELSHFPKVAVKVRRAHSVTAPYSVDEMEPFLRRLYDSFGPRRLLWAADQTTLKCTYAECLALFQEELAFLSAEDREWVLGKSAAEILRWPEASP